MGGFAQPVGTAGGAALGSVIPGVGTALGAGIGGGIGGALGSSGAPQQPGQIAPQPQPQGVLQQGQPDAGQIGEAELAQLLLLLSQIFGQLPSGGQQ